MLIKITFSVPLKSQYFQIKYGFIFESSQYMLHSLVKWPNVFVVCREEFKHKSSLEFGDKI